MYYVKEMKLRTYYINVFLRNWSFLLAFHNECYDKLVIAFIVSSLKEATAMMVFGVMSNTLTTPIYVTLFVLFS